MMTESFHISLFEGTLHFDKIHVRFKIANITHDTVAIFRTEVKFSPGDSRRYDILWWYHVNNTVRIATLCIM